ncbi:unnamed protein product [Rhizophagus irregularis]|nr:unnamed protein product [Rhizophagus irregularis]
MLQPSHSTIPLQVPNQPYHETAAKAGTHRLTKQTAVEASLKEGNAEMIWKVWNFKTIYRNDKEMEKEREKVKVPTTTPLTSLLVNIATPQTHPDRIYIELEKMAASKYQN